MGGPIPAEVRYPIPPLRSARVPRLAAHQTDLLHEMIRMETHGAGHRVGESHSKWAVGAIDLPEGFGIEDVCLSLVHHRPVLGSTLIVVDDDPGRWMERVKSSFPTLSCMKNDSRGVVVRDRYFKNKWGRVIYLSENGIPVLHATNVWFKGGLGPRRFASAFGSIRRGPDDIDEDRADCLVIRGADLPSFNPLTSVRISIETQFISNVEFYDKFRSVFDAVSSLKKWWPTQIEKCQKVMLLSTFEGEEVDYAIFLPKASLPLIHHGLGDEEGCPVCLEPLLRSVVLICGHSFCTSCAERVLQHQGNWEGKAPCPTCRNMFGKNDMRPPSIGAVKQRKEIPKLDPIPACSTRIDAAVALAMYYVLERRRVAIRAPRFMFKILMSCDWPTPCTDDPLDKDAPVCIVDDTVKRLTNFDALIDLFPARFELGISPRMFECYGKEKTVNVHRIYFQGVDDLL